MAGNELYVPRRRFRRQLRYRLLIHHALRYSPHARSGLPATILHRLLAHAGRWWKRLVTGRLTLMEEMDPRLEAHLKLCHEIYLRMRAEGTWPWADSQFSEDLVESDSQPDEP